MKRDEILAIVNEGGVALEAYNHERYEERIVNMLFSRYGLPGKVKRRLLTEQEHLDGRAHLTLAGFNMEYPTFPMYLAARKWAKIAEMCTVARCFNDFEKQKFVEEYLTLWEECDSDKPFGLVFHWPYLKGPVKKSKKGRRLTRSPSSGPNLIIHNETDGDTRCGLRWFWALPNGITLVVEPFAELLADLCWEL